MCGRFTLASPGNIVAEVFGLDEEPLVSPRFNIAPTQDVTVVRTPAGRRQAGTLQWGLVPSWAKDEAIGSKLINARAETVAEKPAFRAALRARRCLVLADGFYEWQPAGGRKQPWYFRAADGRPFAFAGLWERWQPAAGEAVESCTIITTEANDLVRPVHERMPVILPLDVLDRWLGGGSTDALQALLRPAPEGFLEAYPVSLRVNSPSNDDPGCIARCHL
ncbi:MAG: SOS response-associated peptidase [Thermoanaerobaculaceae bacterium]|nr:SOS response-associated peptidase [Thermoanaerobaculaceae bacterium]